jgi:hypothetical protein
MNSERYIHVDVLDDHLWVLIAQHFIDRVHWIENIWLLLKNTIKARLYKIRNITDLKAWFCSCFGKRCLRRPLKGHMKVFQGVVGKLASGRDQLQNTKGIFLMGSVQRSFIGKQSLFCHLGKWDSIFRFWAYLVKVIPDTRYAH